MINKFPNVRQFEWTLGGKKLLAEKQDSVRIAILVTIAFAIGVYLIATTVLITKDGVFYIEQAQNFLTDPISIIKEHPPGYPILIFVAHKLITLLGISTSTSTQTWIYCAQGVSLLCRLLAITSLYFIGKTLVGSERSFWAVLILIILPYPAEFGSDIIREWPHVMFLTWGMLFLIHGAKQNKWWSFGLAGITAGLGYTIRPECAQIVLYGILWLVYGLLRFRQNNMSKLKLGMALIILLAGFSIAAGPYIKASGDILPQTLKEFLTFIQQRLAQKIQMINISNNTCIYTAVGLPCNVFRAISELIKTISENLFYFFAFALAIGIYRHSQRKSRIMDPERFFVYSFIITNIGMLIILYCFRQNMSRRHCLPLVVFLIFYVPDGLQAIADFLTNRLKGKSRMEQNSRKYFFVLLLAGCIICLPKLIKPMRVDKKSYRDAAEWLNKNTAPAAIIATPDSRISFYAERKYLGYLEDYEQISEQVNYIVKIVKTENKKIASDKNLTEEYSTWTDNKKNKKLIIYRTSQ